MQYTKTQFKCLLMIGLIFWMTNALSAQQTSTITLTPIQDNTLYESEAGDLSNGAGNHFFAGKTRISQLRRGLIQFDLSSIPTDAIIESVSLEVNVSNAVGGARLMKMHRLRRSWGEGSSNAPGAEGKGTTATTDDATWIHAVYPSVNWFKPGGDFIPIESASLVIDGEGKYTWEDDFLAFDVQDWVDDADRNYGWIIIGDESTEETAKRFDSKESTSPPVLTVVYSSSDDGNGDNGGGDNGGGNNGGGGDNGGGDNGGGGSDTDIDSTIARVQIIHNVADRIAASLDLFLGGQLVGNDLSFPSATPFFEVPANQNLDLSIASSLGGRPRNIGKFKFNGGKRYILMASGVINKNQYDRSVNRDIVAKIVTMADAREEALFGEGFVDLIAYHGATDAPAIKVYMPQILQTPVEDLEYANFTDYTIVPAISGMVELEVMEEESETLLGAFGGDLSLYSGQAVTIFAAGFVNPRRNRNGAAFSLNAALPSGEVVPLTPLNLEGRSLAIEPLSETSIEVFPNPADNQLMIATNANTVDVLVFDLLGRTLKSVKAHPTDKTFDISELNSGQYLLKLTTADKISVLPIVVK